VNRPFVLPDSPRRADSEAYAYLCERPDIWAAWCDVAPRLTGHSASSVAAILRSGHRLPRAIPVSSEHVRSIGRIYRATAKAIET